MTFLVWGWFCLQKIDNFTWTKLGGKQLVSKSRRVSVVVVFLPSLWCSSSSAFARPGLKRWSVVDLRILPNAKNNDQLPDGDSEEDSQSDSNQCSCHVVADRPQPNLGFIDTLESVRWVSGPVIGPRSCGHSCVNDMLLWWHLSPTYKVYRNTAWQMIRQLLT